MLVHRFIAYLDAIWLDSNETMKRVSFTRFCRCNRPLYNLRDLRLLGRHFEMNQTQRGES